MSIKERLKRLFVKDLGKGDSPGNMFEAQDESPRIAPKKTLYNPLSLAINDMLELTFEEAGVYEVCKMICYRTPVEKEAYHSVKYFLRDPAGGEVAQNLALEVLPSEETSHLEYYLFHIIEEFGFDQSFLKLLDDAIFVVTEEYDDGNTLEKEYRKTFEITLHSETLQADGTQVSRDMKSWNYELDHELETMFLSIEMDTSDGWFTIYEGRKLLRGEVELYPLS